MKYTKIKLNAPSKYLVDDLWISKSAPLWVSFKSLYSSVSWLFGILIYVLLSILASLIAGLISFSDDPVPKKTLLIHGLRIYMSYNIHKHWNFLTFINTCWFKWEVYLICWKFNKNTYLRGCSIVIIIWGITINWITMYICNNLITRFLLKCI
jgi:hypothetical protein